VFITKSRSGEQFRGPARNLLVTDWQAVGKSWASVIQKEIDGQILAARKSRAGRNFEPARHENVTIRTC
jgi:hypothetical protein